MARFGKASARERLEENRQKTREFLKFAAAHRAMTALAAHERNSLEEIHNTVVECLDRVLEERPEMEVPKKHRGSLIAEIAAEVNGLGPIQGLLAEPEISEVMVNGPYQVYVERRGRLTLTDVNFRDDAHAQHVLNRILAPLSRRCDVKVPLVDARLADGSRVHAAIPPVALNGPTITIRKFSEVPYDLAKLAELGAVSHEVADFLSRCVRMKLNIVISGGTGSGKTTLLNALSGEICENERIVTIEDSAELSLQVDHIVGLEARMPNIEGKGAVTVRDLVRNALRMRPDRIVVGECRGAEALDMLQAMNTGHEGSMTTAHANTAQEMVARIETMVLMAGTGATVQGIREQIASAVDLIVQTRRFPDGPRRITQLTEVLGMDGEKLLLRDLFLWNATGVDERGRHLGELLPTGQEPDFLEHMKIEGMAPDPRIFQTVSHSSEARFRSIQSILEATGIKWPL
ncbi:MAG: CpaF family protein [Candidatus Wallbacteria bacterium]|nr:CpaF family protein [Candidatus Wallbacteria bacterium]